MNEVSSRKSCLLQCSEQSWEQCQVLMKQFRKVLLERRESLSFYLSQPFITTGISGHRDLMVKVRIRSGLGSIHLSYSHSYISITTLTWASPNCKKCPFFLHGLGSEKIPLPSSESQLYLSRTIPFFLSHIFLRYWQASISLCYELSGGKKGGPWATHSIYCPRWCWGFLGTGVCVICTCRQE